MPRQTMQFPSFTTQARDGDNAINTNNPHPA